MSFWDEMLIHGLPADDWPGIPNVDWGMGSRVAADVVGTASGTAALEMMGAEPIKMTIYGTVVGATQQGPEGYLISVRIPDGDYVKVLPSQVRLVSLKGDGV